MTNRVVIGKRGTDLGVWVSKPTFDVLTAIEDNLMLSMTYKSEQIIQFGVAAVSATVALPAGLSTSPAVFLFAISGSQFGTGLIRPYPNVSQVSVKQWATVSATQFVMGSSGSGTVPLQYFVLRRALIP